jgi:hypothetical protein
MWRCLERGPQSGGSPADSTHEASSGGSSRIPSRWARQALRVVQSQMVMMSGRWVFKVDISQFIRTLDRAFRRHSEAHRRLMWANPHEPVRDE